MHHLRRKHLIPIVRSIFFHKIIGILCKLAQCSSWVYITCMSQIIRYFGYLLITLSCLVCGNCFAEEWPHANKDSLGRANKTPHSLILSLEEEADFENNNKAEIAAEQLSTVIKSPPHSKFSTQAQAEKSFLIDNIRRMQVAVDKHGNPSVGYKMLEESNSDRAAIGQDQRARSDSDLFEPEDLSGQIIDGKVE